jgi:hypothetical protein
MDMKKLGLTLLLVTVVSGCNSTPDETQPLEFDTNNSFALNIAKQSSLTSGGGLHSKSPLRDFTQEEVDEVRANVHKNYGSASKVLGTLSVLTGNFTGIIDVAGGYAADFGNSNHQAVKPRWLIALDKADFQSKEAAYVYAHQTVVEASVDLLGQYGTVIRKVNDNSGSQYFELDVSGTRSVVGLVSKVELRTKVTEGEFYSSSSSSAVDSYLIGFENKMHSTFNNVPIITIANNVIESLDVSEDVFYKELSSKLPKGFYLYMPSFPKFTAYDHHYTDLEAIVPSIYSQGQKHDFINP